uniref:Myeloid-associated differentiation marker homolog n=1 Tax=Oryzias latipes TaxID=8090 RepID=A0A3P9HYW8_ORYLA
MPVIVLEARDFTSPLFLMRTWEVIAGGVAFSLAAVEHNDSNVFRTFCMFTWCFFFTLTFLIHVLSIIQFHSLIPISWKNLTVTVAVYGALMSLSASVYFPWKVMPHEKAFGRNVVATVASCLTAVAYTSESVMLGSQAQEQKGYMGSLPGMLKILQLWGGCQNITLVVKTISELSDEGHTWQTWVLGVCYVSCVFMSLVTLLVILGDLTGRCLLPFDRFLTGFTLSGVLLYMLATVICFTKILQLRGLKGSMELIITETVLCTISLLAYTVDLAFSIKHFFDRSSM